MSFHKKLPLLVLLLASLWTYGTEGYGAGAPSDAQICQKMLPGHGAEPQNSTSPYGITISNLKPLGGDTVKITLSAPGEQYFKGFLAMVKTPGDPSSNIGKFKVTSHPDAQAIGCFGKTHSAMTHKSNSEKKSVTLEWVAPNEEDIPELNFVATFVREGDEIWQAIVHPQKLALTKNANAVTPAPQKRVGDATRQKLKEYYADCDGTTKGCIGLPSGCVQTFLDTQDQDIPQTCNVMLAWRAEGTRNIYNLTGMPGTAEDINGYIAMGFSEDRSMGKDSVVGCYVDNSAQNGVSVHRFVNPSKSNVRHENPTLGLTAKGVAKLEGHLFCSFEQTNHAIPNGLDVDIRGKNYFLILSRATSASASGLGKHADTGDRAVSGETIAITDTGIYGAEDSRILLQLHGAFMIVAWLLCASSGMFTARYYKLTHTDFMPFNKAFWFTFHLICMFSTVFLTACGAIFIFVKKGGYYPEDGKWWHPILGMILFGLAICQVLIAFIRPNPNTKWRPLFNWVHWTIGNSAHIIGIACIFLANDLSTANLDKEEYLFVMMGAVLFHIVMHLIMSFHTLWADKQMNHKTKRAVTPGPMKPNGLSDEAPGTGFRSFMLALYFIGLLGCAVALIVFISAPIEKITVAA